MAKSAKHPRPRTERLMANVLAVLSTGPKSKTEILRRTGMSDRSYPHTIKTMTELNYITRMIREGRRMMKWELTGEGHDTHLQVLQEPPEEPIAEVQIVSDDIDLTTDGEDTPETVADQVVRFSDLVASHELPNIQFTQPVKSDVLPFGDDSDLTEDEQVEQDIKGWAPRQPFTPAETLSTEFLLRINLTDVLALLHAVIGDSERGELTWTQNGNNFTIRTDGTNIHLFMGG